MCTSQAGGRQETKQIGTSYFFPFAFGSVPNYSTEDTHQCAEVFPLTITLAQMARPAQSHSNQKQQYKGKQEQLLLKRRCEPVSVYEKKYFLSLCRLHKQKLDHIDPGMPTSRSKQLYIIPLWELPSGSSRK